MTQPNPFEERQMLSRYRFGEEFVGAIEERLAEEVKRLSKIPRQKGEAASVLDAGTPPILGGAGGEHLVFGLAKKNTPEKMRNVVVKVNIRKTFEIFRPDILEDAAAVERGKVEMEREMESREDRLSEMRRYFGNDAVPVQRFFICDMPISERIVKGWDQLHRHPSHRHWIPEGETLTAKTIPAWVEVQRRIDLDPEKTVSLNGTYLEDATSPLKKLPPDESERSYVQAHEVLIGRTDLDPEEQHRIVLKVFPTLKRVAERVSDPAFMKGLQDMVRRLIAYSGETGIPLDLVGKNNVVLTETAQGWRPRLLDPLLPDDHAFSAFGTAAHGARKGWILDGQLRSGVFNALNTVRVTNALAILAGIPDRLRIKDLEKLPADGWHRIISEGQLRAAA